MMGRKFPICCIIPAGCPAAVGAVACKRIVNWFILVFFMFLLDFFSLYYFQFFWGAMTSPWMEMIQVLGMQLLTTLMDLVIDPSLPLLSKVTEIFATAPGGTGSFGGSATVHPQLARAEVIMRLDLPVLVNSKE